MDAPIFKRPHVTSLLETDSLLESLWKHNCTEQNVIHILKGVDDVDAETYWFEIAN